LCHGTLLFYRLLVKQDALFQKRRRRRVVLLNRWGVCGSLGLRLRFSGRLLRWLRWLSSHSAH
jgi:hypothetical protein